MAFVSVLCVESGTYAYAVPLNALDGNKAEYRSEKNFDYSRAEP